MESKLVLNGPFLNQLAPFKALMIHMGSYINLYTYIYMCVCVCIFVSVAK